ncbi:MAG: HAD family hydrolase [Sedimentisphaerales bacterium]|jgi:D,D-heptose 1,7-bisphosphate phosphatase
MANKAIFLDRDNTIIEDPGYINNPDQVKLLDGAPEALSSLKALGYKLVVVSNQSGVARGIITEEVLGQIHKRLEQLLAEKGVSLDRIYYCPYHIDGVIPKYRKDSDWRKPNPGMLLAASMDMDIDLKESWMVGDTTNDIEAGARVGCRTIMLAGRTHEQKLQPGAPAPDYRAVNLKEVVNIIKMKARTAQKPANVLPAEQPTQAIEEKPPASPDERASRGGQEPAPQQQVMPQQQAAPQQAEPEQPAPSQPAEQMTTERLLSNILDQIKKMQRHNMFGEFSVTQLIAGIAQGLVFLCLLASIWFLMSPTKQFNQVLISIGFAILLQLMALTFYVMRGPR